MKNSPGSMIGGIGLTTCVRDVQFSRTMAITSSTSASSTPEQDGRVRLLEEARRSCAAGSPGTPCRAGHRRGRRRPRCGRRRRRASSRGVWTTARPGQRGSVSPRTSDGDGPTTIGVVRCALRPVTRVQESTRVERRSVPRSSIQPVRGDRRRGRGRRPRCRPCGHHRAGVDAPRRDHRRDLPRRPRPGRAVLAASVGLPRRRRSPQDAQDPAHPFHEAAIGRIATFDREAPMR